MPHEQSKVLCPMYRTPAIKRYQKGWRIEFYYAENGELHRQDIRVEKYRRKFANAETAYYWIQENICIPLTKKLRSGWTPKEGSSITREIIKGDKITVQTLLDDFINYKEDAVQAKQLSENSFVNYLQRIETIRKSMKPEYSDILLSTPLDEITPMIAKKYIMRLAALREWEVKTSNNFIKFWRMIYKFAIDNGYTDKNPFEKVSLFVGEEKSKRTLTKEEQIKIYNYLHRENLPFLIFTQLVYTDLIRPVEIFRLQCKDLDPTTRKIILPASKTKNKKERVLLIPQSLEVLFDRYLQEIDYVNTSKEAYLFSENFRPKTSNEPLPSVYASIRWRKMCQELNLPLDCKLYGLRHTGICDLLAVLPLNTVRMLADHSDTKQTIHYANHETEKIRKEVAEKAPIYGV